MLTPEQSARFFVWLAGGTKRTGEFIQIEEVSADIEAFYQRIEG
jgi:hypothetical protein